MQLLAYPRESRLLDGRWQAIPDQYESFDDPYSDVADEDGMVSGSPIKPIYTQNESNKSKLADFNIEEGYSVAIPSSWGEELPEFRHYEGRVWFAKRFTWTPKKENSRSLIRFGAVNYKAKVWLNGELVGVHEGGFTPFTIDVSEVLTDGHNNLIVQVDNSRYEDGIPAKATDWYNFGGITRSVELISVPQAYIRNYKIDTSIDHGEIVVTVSVWLEGTNTKPSVRAAFPELQHDVELLHGDDSAYVGELRMSPDEVELWHPSEPHLYTIQIEAGEDRIQDEIGLREVQVVDCEIYLNGEPIELQGISLHEESAGKGRALDSEDIETRFEWIKELGCNFARLAHYPHTEEMARKADEEGILLWEEVPAYWDIKFGNPEVQKLYCQQLRELIQRDWNRPSVILWSIANETDYSDEKRNKILPEMVEYVQTIDDTRLVTAACFASKTDEGITIEDPLEDCLDVVGVNEYFGWYYGESTDMNRFQDDPNGKPIIISETGGGAKWGFHGSKNERWTEEFQARIYRDQINAIKTKGQIVGMTPWILFDFRAPMRQNEYQRGYNRKGLIDQYGRKKKAYYVLRDFYRSVQ